MSVQTNRVIERATRYVQKRQFDKALNEYDRALQADPEDLRILHKKGDLLVKMEAMALAVQTYLKLAGLYSRLGFHVKAIAVYKQALKTEAAPIEIHLRLCEEYDQLRMKREAMDSLDLVLDEYERTRRFDEMKDVLERLMELDADSIEPTMRLCDLLLLQDQRAEAVDLLARTANKLEEEERRHEHREVMERLVALDPDYDLGESYLARHFPTLVAEAPGLAEPQEISDTDIFPVETAEQQAPARPATPPPLAALVESHFFMDPEATPSSEIEPADEEGETNVLDQGEEPVSDEDMATVVMDASFLDSVQKSHPAPRQEPPAPVAAFTPDELDECLQEIDFFVLQKLFDDAWEMLQDLKVKMPNNPRILSCLQSVAELRRKASGRFSPLGADSLSDCLLSVA